GALLWRGGTSTLASTGARLLRLLVSGWLLPIGRVVSVLLVLPAGCATAPIFFATTARRAGLLVIRCFLSFIFAIGGSSNRCNGVTRLRGFFIVLFGLLAVLFFHRLVLLLTAAAPARAGVSPASTLCSGIVMRFAAFYRFVVHDDPAACTVLTGVGEDFYQAGAHPFPGHLHQAQRSDFCHLVAGTVPTQAFDQAAYHQVAVGFQYHIDKVDDDDTADIAQP